MIIIASVIFLKLLGLTCSHLPALALTTIFIIAHLFYFQTWRAIFEKKLKTVCRLKDEDLTDLIEEKGKRTIFALKKSKLKRWPRLVKEESLLSQQTNQVTQLDHRMSPRRRERTN